MEQCEQLECGRGGRINGSGRIWVAMHGDAAPKIIMTSVGRGWVGG